MNVRRPPSPVEASLTDSAARPDAVIVPLEVPSLMLMLGGRPPAGADIVIVNSSSPSTSSSSDTGTVIACVSASPVAPVAKVRLPLVDV